MTRLKALHDNGRCWKKGDEFKIYFDSNGCAFVVCYYREADSRHYVLRSNGDYACTPEECSEYFEVIDEQPADPLRTDPAGTPGTQL